MQPVEKVGLWSLVLCLFFLCGFFGAGAAHGQTPPISCTSVIDYPYASIPLADRILTCKNNGSDWYYLRTQNPYFYCARTSACTCPAGFTPTVVDGVLTCAPPPPDNCEPPNVLMPVGDGNSICTAPCQSNQHWDQVLGACASGCPQGFTEFYGVCAQNAPDESFCPFNTNYVDGVCVAIGECPGGAPQVVTDLATGAATCGSNDSNSSSPPASSSPSNSSPPSASSSPPTSSSGSGTSTPSSSGSGDGPGDGPGDGSGDGPGNGGGSSGSGSSQGAGDCDPTSRNYLSCVTGTTSRYGGRGEPAEQGTFDSDGVADLLAQTQAEYADLVNSIKAEAQSIFQVDSLSVGSGGLVDYCKSIRDVQVCFGWGRFSEYLNLIAAAILLVGAVVAFGIVMRR